MTPVLIDFAAWAEDRRELTALREETEAHRRAIHRIAARLQIDATKIHQACDNLDMASRALGRL